MAYPINSKHVIVDGTFDTTECKLVLTTILALHEDVGIPCAYLLSSSKETDNYEAFYTVQFYSIINHFNAPNQFEIDY